MFLEHFSLREDPFALTPDPRFLYLSPGHREALASLYYSVTEGRGCAVMAGGVGAGKTVLLNYLRSKIENRADVIALACPPEDKNELICTLLQSLQVEPAASYSHNWRQLETLLQARREQGRAVVLLADEAHQFGDDALQSLRLLRLQIVLAGGPSLTARLASPELESVAQRVNVFCQLRPLEHGETAPYIHHRLAVAGANGSPFTDGAIELIGSLASGVPLKINRLCYQAMSCAWLHSKQRVGEDAVWQVLEELPLPEIFVSSNPRPLLAAAHGT